MNGDPNPVDDAEAGADDGLSLQAGMSRSAMTFEELWLRQVSVGGHAGQLEVEAYLLGLLSMDDYQHDVIAQAINEHFVELGQDHPVSYSWGEPQPVGDSGSGPERAESDGS